MVDEAQTSCCLLDNDNIVVTLGEDKIKLLNWEDIKSQNLTSVDWIKKGEVDIIRCGKWQTIPTFYSFNHSYNTQTVQKNSLIGSIIFNVGDAVMCLCFRTIHQKFTPERRHSHIVPKQSCEMKGYFFKAFLFTPNGPVTYILCHRFVEACVFHLVIGDPPVTITPNKSYAMFVKFLWIAKVRSSSSIVILSISFCLGLPSTRWYPYIAVRAKLITYILLCV